MLKVNAKQNDRHKRAGAWVLLLWIACLLTACERAEPSPESDAGLRQLAVSHGARPLEAASGAHSKDKIKLGRMLFFDRELSGNRDTSCATCHHPAFGMTDGRELSVGAGGTGDTGPMRVLGEGRIHAARNAPTLLNVNDSAWRVQFWDGRVEQFRSGDVRNPASGSLPGGLESVVAAQAMFPVLSRDEMRGERGDTRVDGEENELAKRFDSDQLRIWEGVTARLLQHEGYRDLFARAYPEVEQDALSFEHAANAMAAFEQEELALTNSPFDRFLRGEDDALSDGAKRGARLFYGEAGCATCHGGALLSDQRFYNIAAPQLGPGKGADKPLDFGRGRVSMDPRDNFKFRTPSLRHVAFTAPYMHSGAYETLEEAILHHVAPADALAAFDGARLRDTHLKATGAKDGAARRRILETLSEEIAVVPRLSDAQVDDLVTFLEACGDPAVTDLDHLIPARVPSGLELDTVQLTKEQSEK